MLFLLFQIGADRYGLEARRVVEVVPRVELKKIPRAPAGVAGMFDYHRTLMPVIDLSALSLNRASVPRLSTRIIVVNYPSGAEEQHLLGVMAEQATEVVRLDPEVFKESGVETPEAPYLGRVTRDARGLIQWIEIEKLLTKELRDQLFRPIKEFV